MERKWVVEESSVMNNPVCKSLFLDAVYPRYEYEVAIEVLVNWKA